MNWSRHRAGPRPGIRLGCAFALFLAIIGVVLLWRHCGRTRRWTAYDAIIWEAARRHGVSPFLVKAVVYTESRFNPWAVGSKSEIGLMQITDGAVQDWEDHTGRRCPLRGLLFDPRLNIEIGTWYLGHASARWQDYRDAEVLILAQYNAGPSRAAAWSPADPQERLSLDSISFPSTREYIRIVREYSRKFEKEHRRRESKQAHLGVADSAAG